MKSTQRKDINTSGLDREYFNKFKDGYSPYTTDDLNLMLSDLIAVSESKNFGIACEVGSADGQFSLALKKHLPKMNFFGIDIAEQILKLYPYNKICGSAFCFPIADKSVNLIICPASFHHLAPFDESLAELCRILAPGGIIYFMEPNYYHPQRRFFMSNKSLYHRYRKVDDVPVNPEILVQQLNKKNIHILVERFITLHFKNPSILQSIQNVISKLPWPENLKRFIMPWFIIIAKKPDK